MALTPLAVAALGLLSERPMHPYEMFQTLIARGEDRLVKVRPGTLYHAVERLRDAGFVSTVGTGRAGNRPERTTYEITADGRTELRNWVRTTVAEPVDEFPRFPVAIAEVHNLPADEAADLLERRLVLLRGDEVVYADVVDRMNGKGIEERYGLDIEYLRAVLAAEIAWLGGLIHRLRSGDIDWPDASGLPAPSGAVAPDVTSKGRMS